MVEERSNLDYGRDDRSADDVQTVEGDGFVMTDADETGMASDYGEEETDEEVESEG